MSDLSDRMRTCAAYLLDRAAKDEPWAAAIVRADAADLLVEASNIIAEATEALGEPMALLHASPTARPQAPDATWVSAHDTMLPGGFASTPRSSKTCPQCYSNAHKRVFRAGKRLMLACPVCAKEWPYG